MEPKTLVAIEIASSKVKGAVGTVGPDGRLAVIAVEDIAGINNVRYGRVQNIREVSASVNEVIRRLEEATAVSPRKIRSIAVGFGGRSVMGVQAKAAMKFDQEVEITDKNVERLAYHASSDIIGDKVVITSVPRMFYVNNGPVRRPVGTYGETLSGEFTMITCGRETKQNLDRLKYDTIEPDQVAYILRPTAIADFVLSADEREVGAALIDIGAETSTIVVYKDGTPTFLCTVPMGSRLITTDLMMGFGITEEAAELLKHDYAAGAEMAQTKEVEGYISSRAGEIVANILAQLDNAGYSAASLSKVVLCGAATHINAFEKQLVKQGKANVRNAEMPDNIIFRVSGRNNIDNIDIVALLIAASRRFAEDCLTTPDVVKEEVPEIQTVFEEPKEVKETVVEEPAITPTVEVPIVTGPTSDDSFFGRRNIDENDENLLRDDKDVEEPQQKESRRSFFSFGKRKPKPVQESQVDPLLSALDGTNPEHNRPEPYVAPAKNEQDKVEDSDEEPEEFQQDEIEKSSAIMEGLRRRFLDIFSATSVEEEAKDDALYVSPDEDEEDEDENISFFGGRKNK